MTTVIEAKAGMRELGPKAHAVATDDSLTPAEKMAKLEGYHKDMKAFQDVVAIDESAKRLMSGGEAAPEAKSTSDRKFKSLGRQIVESDAFKTAATSTGKRFSLSTGELGTKVAGTVDEGTSITNGQLNGAGGVLALPDYLPGIVDIRFAPLSVAQLFAQGSTTSPLVSYVKEASETQGAAATSEKTKKGQADATFTRVNEQVGKVAAFFKITDEMMQDVDQAESFLTNRLVAQVAREEENEALNGTGYPALAGILGRSGLQTAINVTSGTIADPMLVAIAIHQQVTAIRTTAFVEPDAVVINPSDWEKILLARDQNGQFYMGGPFFGAYGQGVPSNVASLWGLRVVQSPRIAAGTALVGGFQEGGQLFRRQGITVEMANQNEDDFVNNLITVRAESRSALAIYRPGAFGKVGVTWA